jgi:hypothetical protein
VARAAKHSKAVVDEPAASVIPVAEPLFVVPAEPAVVAPTPVKTVSQEEIAKLAFCYWADRGYQGGSPEEDWLRAEQTLLAAL